MINVNAGRLDIGHDRRLVDAAIRRGAAPAALGHLRLGSRLMEWRIRRRIGALGLALSWAQYEPLDRQWCWTKDETKAFTAHNRYIVEAMQRRTPDWMRYSSEIEQVPNGDEVEEPAPAARKRAPKREDVPC